MRSARFGPCRREGKNARKLEKKAISEICHEVGFTQYEDEKETNLHRRSQRSPRLFFGNLAMVSCAYQVMVQNI